MFQNFKRKEERPALHLEGCIQKVRRVLCKERKIQNKTPPNPAIGTKQAFTVSYCFHFIAHRSKASHSEGVSKKDCVTVESKIIQRGICKWSEFSSLAQMGVLALLIREKLLLLLPAFYAEGPRTLCINGKMK